MRKSLRNKLLTLGFVTTGALGYFGGRLYEANKFREEIPITGTMTFKRTYQQGDSIVEEQFLRKYRPIAPLENQQFRIKPKPIPIPNIKPRKETDISDLAT